MVQLLGLNDTHKKQAWGRRLQNSGKTLDGTQKALQVARVGWDFVSLENTHEAPHKGGRRESTRFEETISCF